MRCDDVGMCAGYMTPEIIATMKKEVSQKLNTGDYSGAMALDHYLYERVLSEFLDDDLVHTKECVRAALGRKRTLDPTGSKMKFMGFGNNGKD